LGRILKLAGGVALAAGAGWAVAPSCGLVPGWSQDGAARTYTADNLYEYMDGNSEGYFLYNFQEMRGVTCKRGEATLVVDISDMGQADFAYGMYSSTRDLRQPEYQVGTGGQIVPRRLIFAKGQYYVEIAANPEGDYAADLRAWAAALDRAVPGSTAVPPEFAWFPAAGRQSLRMVPESVLGLRMLKRGYLAQYDFGKAFLVVEDSPAAARAVFAQLQAHFGDTTPAKMADGAFLAADRYLGRLCVFLKSRYLGGYAITAPGQDPAALAAPLAAQVR